MGLPTSMHLFEYTARCCCWARHHLAGRLLLPALRHCIGPCSYPPHPAAHALPQTPRCRYKKHAGLDCYPPLQIMFAAKTTNRGKLDSHCWFFDGFAYLLQPDFCVLFDAGELAQGGHAADPGIPPRGWHARTRAGLLDIQPHLPCLPPTPLAAGTKPMPFALRNTYAHFKRNPWCGGLTGELRVERPYRNFLTSVQYMEWKVGQTGHGVTGWRCCTRVPGLHA